MDPFPLDGILHSYSHPCNASGSTRAAGVAASDAGISDDREITSGLPGVPRHGENAISLGSASCIRIAGVSRSSGKEADMSKDHDEFEPLTIRPQGTSVTGRGVLLKVTQR